MRIVIDDEDNVLTCRISEGRNAAGNHRNQKFFYNCSSKERIRAKTLIVEMLQKL